MSRHLFVVGKNDSDGVVTFSGSTTGNGYTAPDIGDGRYGRHLFAVPDPRSAGAFIEFAALGSDEDGYTARAVEHSIFTGADTWHELCMAAVDAVRRHLGDPDSLQSDHIQPGWGNGVLDSILTETRKPTPPDEFDSTLAASVLREAVMQMGASPSIADIFIEYTQRVIDERVDAKVRDGSRDPNEAA